MNAGPGKLDARAKEFFAAALERPEAERKAFLEQACSGDAGLRRQVETLLRNLGDAQERFEEPQPAPGEQPGETIGHYKLRQKIGEGGFGVVWMAEQEQPVRRMVALKVLKPGMDTAQVIGRFEAERQALALMDHPNIAKVFDGGATPTGRPYFVMELVKGVPITKYCDDAGMSMEERLKLFVPVCQAVQHAHQKGVIHRDIKPSNVLVTLHDGTPVPKVIDFGIAKAARGALTQRTVFTEFRQMIGTPEYMAPEQADLSALDVDTRADVYSLGVVLYELLTGTRPFELRTLLEAGYAEMLRTIREVDPPKPSTRVSTLGDQVSEIARHRRTAVRSLGSLLRGDLDWIVMKALEKERSRRYETASALAEDVQRHLRNEPVMASPPSRVYRLRKYVRRHRIGAIATCAVALSLVAGAVAAGLGYVEARDQAELARLAEKRADTERAAAVESAAEAQRQKEAAQAAEREAREQAERAEMESTLACTEANRAESVVMLLTTMLASGDPHVTRDKDYPVRSVLEDFERSLGDALKGQPEVEATLRRVLGGAYLGLGLPEKAEPHLLRAAQLRRDVLGAGHPLVVQSLSDEATLRHEQGRYDVALATVRQARQALPDEDAGLAPDSDVRLGELRGTELKELRVDLLRAEGDYLRHLGDKDGAEASCGAALALAERLLGRDSAAAFRSMASLAGVLMDANRSAEAEPLLRAWHDHVRASSGESGAAYLVSLNNLGTCLMQLERYADAEELLRTALDEETRLLGEGAPSLAIPTHNLGLCLVKQGKVHQGAEYLRAGLALMRKNRPENSPDIERRSTDCVKLLIQHGDQPGGEQLQRERVERLSDELGESHPEVARALRDWVDLVLGRGDLVQAEWLARRAHDITVGAEGPESLATARSWLKLGDVLWTCRALEAAAECYEAALTLLEARSDASTDVTNALIQLAGVNRERGEFEVSVQQQQRVLERMEREGRPAVKLAVQRQRMAAMLVDANRPAEGEIVARQALDSLRSEYPACHENVLGTQATLAQALLELARPEEAETLLHHGQAGCSEEEREVSQPTLVLALLAQGKGAEAEPLARECLDRRETAMPGHWLYASAMSMVGEALLLQGRLDEAEALLLDAAERMPSDVPRVRRRVAPLAYRRLIRLYEAQGRDAEAQLWCTKLEALQQH